jgi:GT2 family glycosyltransferase
MLSVIIPTCNRNDLLSKCLNQLSPATQGIDKDSYEVIVTDDSRDNIAKSLIEENYNWVKWIEGPKKGPAANRNNGAQHADSDWLVFLDDDCLPQKDWLLSYQYQIQNNAPETVFEGCTMADRPRKRLDEESPVNLNGGNLWSCNFAIHKSIFNRLNGFDESFPFAAMEDVDFHIRVLRLANVVFVPGAVVIHPWRRVAPFKSLKKHLRSHKYFLDKHFPLRDSSFRLKRAKIFAITTFKDFNKLMFFSMRGWQYYIENCTLNFCLIFI